MIKATSEATRDRPQALAALRRERENRRGHAEGHAEGRAEALSADRNAIREDRLDKIDAARKKLWAKSLRLSQVVNIVLILSSLLFIMWWDYAYWAAAAAAGVACSGMWVFARRMAPREERLRRFMVAMTRRRRRCVVCNYLLRDMGGAKCPECGTDFDPQDDRHILAQETLHSYSSRARSVSAIVIAFVLFSASAMARGSGWQVHAGLALALFAVFNVLHAIWLRRARQVGQRQGAAVAPRSTHCPACDARLQRDMNVAAQSSETADDPAQHRRALPRVCPGCDCRLTYADVFVRPDVRCPTDRRANRLQYRMLMLRWAFLVLLFAGLVAFVGYSGLPQRLQGLGVGGPAFVVGLVGPVLVWVMLLTLVFRYIARRLVRHLKLLFAQVSPQCPRCAAGLGELDVGSPCPTCARDIDPLHLRGW